MQLEQIIVIVVIIAVVVVLPILSRIGKFFRNDAGRGGRMLTDYDAEQKQIDKYSK